MTPSAGRPIGQRVGEQAVLDERAVIDEQRDPFPGEQLALGGVGLVVLLGAAGPDAGGAGGNSLVAPWPAAAVASHTVASRTVGSHTVGQPHRRRADGGFGLQVDAAGLGAVAGVCVKTVAGDDPWAWDDPAGDDPDARGWTDVGEAGGLAPAG